VYLSRRNSEQRGLTRPIRPNDYPTLIGFNLPIYVVQNCTAVTNYRDVVEINDARHAFSLGVLGFASPKDSIGLERD
jgi:hypothetical protein